MTGQFDEAAKRFRHDKARKRAVNVTIDGDVLAQAKKLNINLSQTLEDILRVRVKDEREAKWRAENRETIESYNRLIEKAGVFGEEFHDWPGEDD